MTAPARRAAPLLALLCLAGCVSATGGDRLTRHASGEAWAAGLSLAVRRPAEVVPAASLAGLSAALRPFDAELLEDLVQDAPVTGGDTDDGDAVAAALAGVTTGWALARFVAGDEGRTLEAGLEALAITGALTSLLKRTIDRSRPEGSSIDSFPSGHASMTFAAATVLARSVADTAEGPAAWLGWLAYLPAGYVALNRVEGGRHYPSDVAFGAFLGVFVTNVVWDAHFGDPSEGELGIFGSSVILEPAILPGAVGLTLRIDLD